MKALYDNELSPVREITPVTLAQRATLLERCEL
jgi:hypothetical protein